MFKNRVLNKIFQLESLVNIMLIATIVTLFTIILLPDEAFTLICTKFKVIVSLFYFELFLALIYTLIASLSYKKI